MSDFCLCFSHMHATADVAHSTQHIILRYLNLVFAIWVFLGRPLSVRSYFLKIPILGQESDLWYKCFRLYLVTDATYILRSPYLGETHIMQSGNLKDRIILGQSLTNLYDGKPHQICFKSLWKEAALWTVSDGRRTFQRTKFICTKVLKVTKSIHGVNSIFASS